MELRLCSEIAELMSVKSKHGAGGEYSPEWRPKVRGSCFSYFNNRKKVHNLSKARGAPTWATWATPRRGSSSSRSTSMENSTQASRKEGTGPIEDGGPSSPYSRASLSGPD